jgi:hypothetical protein
VKISKYYNCNVKSTVNVVFVDFGDISIEVSFPNNDNKNKCTSLLSIIFM